jgi:hypoxanthine-guanine phosphoribosyltransferase
MSNSLTEAQSSSFSNADGYYGDDFSPEESREIEVLQAMYPDEEIVAPYIPEMIIEQALEWFVEQLHSWLHEQTRNEEKVLIIYNLKGAEYFWNDIKRVWRNKFGYDINRLDIEISPVRVSTSTGEQEFGAVNEDLLEWDIDPKNRKVVSLDDIGDTGRTQLYVRERLMQEGAKEVIVVNETEKDVSKSFEADLYLLWVINKFLLGRGLDSGTKNSELEQMQRELKTIVQLQ